MHARRAPIHRYTSARLPEASDAVNARPAQLVTRQADDAGPTVQTPHDKLFKGTFSQVDHARSVLASVLPARIVALADWATLTLVSGEFDDVLL